MTYFNTTNSEGKTLKEYRQKALSQEQRILAIFQYAYDAGHGEHWTPSEIQQHYFPNTPITSIRRAITNLTKSNDLIKTTYPQIIGPYGRPEHAWKLAKSELTQEKAK